MRYIALWFILTDGSGYIPPMDIKDPICGLTGAVIGIQIDKVVNPTKASWPDPLVIGKHCETDIRDRVFSLTPGQYHIATTEFGDGSNTPYIGIDPHTTGYFTVIKIAKPPSVPSLLKVQ